MSLKYVKAVSFVKNVDSLTPKVFDHTKKYGVEDLHWHILIAKLTLQLKLDLSF
ncbi:hypothetical protein PAXRUDRAFT_20726 [Paxillus rubicundulus Ve08.2h10]|uniref:Uncharacterized protein n=1 Tax=Paxillus rubicundulus Ve08.2h10 TaxID=930991 RepID=A0A0D0CRW1_9AGAM|nr:hypothetical protein PAXRUDRAFT_20726 [Paxillus rubicundulus Ve08.2h10]